MMHPPERAPGGARQSPRLWVPCAAQAYSTSSGASRSDPADMGPVYIQLCGGRAGHSD